MEAVKALMRLFSYLFHGLLAIFLIAVSGLALVSGSISLHLDMLPWSGDTLIYVIFFGSLCGLATVMLAIAGKLRALFFLWALLVAVLLVKGFIFSNYHFAEGSLETTMLIFLPSLIALPGAWFQLQRKPTDHRLRGY